jgi:hypothetical protein
MWTVEIEMDTAGASLHLWKIRECVRYFNLQLLVALVAAVAGIDIENEYAGSHPCSDADIGIWPLLPPAIDLHEVGRSIVHAMRRARVLTGGSTVQVTT